ncbi:thioredoxin family protein [Actinoplanes sp. LDG1-06]|uniref:Thioredoxin family protein n=1 Tax=Paractinoplanes ovalisporus TaxID=2810368 RepID=A0ABS2A5Q3_9ACTN|nr:thioredoxin family protein [Actinoplanes ovalisporus]MBM2615176.1 thioredoxin family protein [Actinoplanes ovalisporus]
MDPVGIGAVVAVLVIGLAVGLWRRRVDGHLRPVSAQAPGSAAPRPDPSLTAPASGAVAADSAATVPAVVSEPAAFVADQREEPGVIEDSGTDPSAAGQRLDAALLEELGVGEAKATLLQFSSAFCAPCRAVRRVSSEVAAMVPGVQHVEVDAESHLDAVRALGIWRTPTLLVLDAEGRVSRRATGVPAKPQLIAALGEVL